MFSWLGFIFGSQVLPTSMVQEDDDELGYFLGDPPSYPVVDVPDTFPEEWANAS